MQGKEKKQSDVSGLPGCAGSCKKPTFPGPGLPAVAMIPGTAPCLCIFAARDLITVAPD